MLDRALGAGVGAVPVGERRQQRRHDGDDRSAVIQPATGLLQEEVRGFRVDVEHRIVFGLSRFHDRLAQHFTDGVDRDVDAAERFGRRVEQPLHVAGDGEVALDLDGLGTGALDRGDGLVGVGLGGCAVVVHRDVDAARAERGADQTAQVLGSGGDDCGLAFEIAHTAHASHAKPQTEANLFYLSTSNSCR